MDGVKITVYNSNPRGRASRDPGCSPGRGIVYDEPERFNQLFLRTMAGAGNASVFAILPMHGENHGAEQQQGRQVGDDHQAVAHVGQGPHRVRLKQAA